MLLDAEQSVVIVVDIQPKFMAPIFEADRFLSRTKLLVSAAKLPVGPVLHTEQYPERMGGTEEEVQALIGQPAFGKMAFSCCGSEEFMAALEKTGATQAILCGIESHICVNQTAHDLIDEEYDVVLATDAVSARTLEMHKLAVKRMRDLGVVTAHSESILYEWMGSADHPKFKEALQLVKEA